MLLYVPSILYMCPHTTMYIVAQEEGAYEDKHIFVLVLLYVCPHTTLYMVVQEEEGAYDDDEFESVPPSTRGGASHPQAHAVRIK